MTPFDGGTLDDFSLCTVASTSSVTRGVLAKIVYVIYDEFKTL